MPLKDLRFLCLRDSVWFLFFRVTKKSFFLRRKFSKRQDRGCLSNESMERFTHSAQFKCLDFYGSQILGYISTPIWRLDVKFKKESCVRLIPNPNATSKYIVAISPKENLVKKDRLEIRGQSDCLHT
jgi:hypothetical protein